MLTSLSSWLEKTSLSIAIQDVSWVIPFCQTVHILCLALVLSSVVFLDVRLMGIGPHRIPVSALAKRFLPPTWGAVAVMALTGAVLVIGEPQRDLPNMVFQIKMLLLVCVLAVTSIIQARIAANPNAWGDGIASWPARIAGAVSLLLWLGIATCGRFIAYFLA